MATTHRLRTQESPGGATVERRSWSILALALIAQLLVVLDISVVNTALPTIGSALHLASGDMQWPRRDLRSPEPGARSDVRPHRWHPGPPPKRGAPAAARPESSAEATSSRDWASIDSRRHRSRKVRSTPSVSGSGAGNRANPLSCSAERTARSSTSASGLPPVWAIRAIRTSAVSGPPACSSSRAPAAAGSIPIEITKDRSQQPVERRKRQRRLGLETLCPQNARLRHVRSHQPAARSCPPPALRAQPALHHGPQRLPRTTRRVCRSPSPVRRACQ